MPVAQGGNPHTWHNMLGHAWQQQHLSQKTGPVTISSCTCGQLVAPRSLQPRRGGMASLSQSLDWLD